jgi:heme exporter protein CcmD
MNVEHFGYIFAAYAIAIGVVGALIVALVVDHRGLKAALAKLPPRAGDDA